MSILLAANGQYFGARRDFFRLSVAIRAQTYYNIDVMAHKTLYFDNFCGYMVAAVLQEKKVVEFGFEKLGSGCAVGNVYKGKVESVLPGMNAAFINCGLDKNCYLSGDDYLPDGDLGGALPKADLKSLSPGDPVLVQVVKLPTGNKGAKVTTRLSFVGKIMIYLPDVPFIGVSRKITDAELKKNLVFAAKKLVSGNEGLVVRSAAPYAKRNQLEAEYTYLKNLYKGVSAAFAAAPVGALLYTDFALPIRVLRDTLSSDIDEIVVGSEYLAKMTEEVINLYPSRTMRPVVIHDTGRDMMNELGVSKQFLSMTSPRVDLENGAYLIIERTEALTVIDVNTGKFTGGENLEQTVYAANMVAAREIARQVRLRNIGGIVVVDFIDMTLPAHRKSVVEELESALKDDRAKCAVSPMSRLGLVEFSRKRIGASLLGAHSKPCRYCGGTGHTPTAEFIIIGLRARLLDIFAARKGDIRIDMNNEVLAKLLAWREMREDIRSHACGKIFAVPHRTYHEEHTVIKEEPFNIPYDAVEI